MRVFIMILFSILSMRDCLYLKNYDHLIHEDRKCNMAQYDILITQHQTCQNDLLIIQNTLRQLEQNHSGENNKETIRLTQLSITLDVRTKHLDDREAFLEAEYKKRLHEMKLKFINMKGDNINVEIQKLQTININLETQYGHLEIELQEANQRIKILTTELHVLQNTHNTLVENCKNSNNSLYHLINSGNNRDLDIRTIIGSTNSRDDYS